MTGQSQPAQSDRRAGNGAWLRLAALEDRIFTDRRMMLCGSGVLAGVVFAVLLEWARYRGQWVVEPNGRLGDIDFCWIWVTGRFAALADAARIYNPVRYAAAQTLYYPPGQCWFLHQNSYPPTFLFFSYLLRGMPYLPAYAAWVVSTLALYLAAVYAIVPRRGTLIAALAPAAVLKNLQLGHNGLLTAGLMGSALSLAERRPWLSGIVLGFLSSKPQFGVLVPLALLASRNWRALAGATAAALTSGAAAGFVFGWPTWPAFTGTLLDRNSDMSQQAGVEFMLDSVYGLLDRAGAAAWLAWTVHIAVALAAAVAVCVVWARPLPLALRAAVLSAASLLESPYLLTYDLCLLSVAAAFLVRDGMDRGFLAGERMVLLTGFAALYLAPAFGSIVAIGLLTLALRRAAAWPAPLSGFVSTAPSRGAVAAQPVLRPRVRDPAAIDPCAPP
jgi:alpha-1,2-mannosyltransferase